MRRMPVLVPHTLCVALVTAFVAAAASGQAQKGAQVTAVSDRSPEGESRTSGHDLASMLRSLDTDLAPSRQDQQRRYPGVLTLDPIGRGVEAMYFDDFSSYPQSADPIFARFAVNMQDQSNPQGGLWDFAQAWHIPTLFVAGQFDDADPPSPDPLPRWQGADLVENAGLGNLFADINGDGVVGTADLSILLGSFGQMGATSGDINLDGVVDTADLGIMFGEFGQSDSPFCVYLVTDTHGVDPDGAALDPTTLANAPIAGQSVAILNGAYTNDTDADGCPDCDSFRILTDGAIGGEQVYGVWALVDPVQPDLVGVDFMADVNADTCAGWGAEAVLVDARSEVNFAEFGYILGAQTMTPFFAPTSSQQIMMNCDFFLTSYDSFIWFDVVDTTSGFIVERVFMGGHAASLSFEFEKYSTHPDGLVNHFVILGLLPPMGGQLFGTVPGPLVGNQGKEIMLNEWFTISIRATQSDLSVWLRDSETILLVDPAPGSDGSATPQDGADDVENGFAKIFPSGPYGPAPGVGDGQLPLIPHPFIAANQVDRFRFIDGSDPLPFDAPNWSPGPIFYDNFRIEGELAP